MLRKAEMAGSYYTQIYVVPAFVVAVGFVDPGNWVTLIEGGSSFGYELAWVVCSAILLAMLLQMVSARLGVATGKHFAEVCLTVSVFSQCLSLSNIKVEVEEENEAWLIELLLRLARWTGMSRCAFSQKQKLSFFLDIWFM
jgi:hypothetical protein